MPAVAKRAEALFASMDFGFYYRPDANRIAYYYTPDEVLRGIRVACCYDTIVSESRIASYVGIATGKIPAKEYFGAWRTFPDTWDWQETKPVGVTRTYLGVSVFEGAYPYDGTWVVPGWGGSMFEALMPALFVPEETWGPDSWAINHPLTVAAQIHHGLVDAGYGYWGFSPANIPEGGYHEYGVDALGMNPEGYPSNEDNTLVDYGFARFRDPQPDPPPSAYTNGVVTPHASFLALRWAAERGAGEPGQAGARLRDLRQVGLPRLGERPDRQGLGLLPVARPGHHHGRDRERARQGHAAPRVRRPAVRAGLADRCISMEEFGAAPGDAVADLGHP